MTSEHVSLRAVSADDAEAIHAMISDLAAHVDSMSKLRSVPEDFRRHLSSDAPAFHGIIAEQDGPPVGLSLYFPSFSSWRGARGVYVQDLYVAEHLRGSGLGRQLLIEVLASARKMWGAEYLRLAVDAGNVGGQRFYEKLGMNWVNEDRVFQVDGSAFAALAGDGSLEWKD